MTILWFYIALVVTLALFAMPVVLVIGITDCIKNGIKFKNKVYFLFAGMLTIVLAATVSIDWCLWNSIMYQSD